MPGIIQSHALAVFAAILFSVTACGPDSIRGRIISIDENRYVVLTDSGREVTMYVDRTTRKNQVAEGDKVRAFVSKDGHADYIQKLD
jgi:hypothetical protein